MNNSVPNDLVLADRGFAIQDLVGMTAAEVKIPALTKGESQMSAHEIESTRKLAHFCIHVEEVIGMLCGMYNVKQ